MGLVAKPVYQDVAALPPRRPMPTPQPKRIDEASLAAFGCDIAHVSDSSTPADVLVTRAVEQAASADLKHLLWETFDRLRGDYETNSAIGHPAGVANRLRQAASAMGMTLTPSQQSSLLYFFDDVNRALFQHQTLAWIAGANFKINLYGNGWERHPTLARHARGVIRDERMHASVVKASKINLSVGVYGAVTPQMVDGVASGGFFLARFCAADVIEKFYPPLIDFCARERLHTNAALADRATPGIRELLAYASRTLGVDVLNDWADFVPHLMSSRAGATQRSRSAAVIWPAHYATICFSSRDELLNRVTQYLYDEPSRREIAEGMCRTLTEPQHRVSVQVGREVAASNRPRSNDEVAA